MRKYQNKELFLDCNDKKLFIEELKNCGCTQTSIKKIQEFLNELNISEFEVTSKRKTVNSNKKTYWIVQEKTEI